MNGRSLDGLHRRHAIPHHYGELFGVIAVRINSGVGSERHTDTRFQRALEIASLNFADHRILADELWQFAPTLRFALRVIGVVDIHREVHLVLLG